jgi:endonuclease/exonuclease/phosphatase family metal-dependent hydrolase
VTRSFVGVAVVVSVAAAAFPGVTAAGAGNEPVGPYTEAEPTCRTEQPPAGAPAAVPDPDPSSIAIGSFNVLFASGTSNESLDARVPLIVDALHASGADVVGIQEDELIGSRGHTSERIARGLSAATGDAWSWCFFMANPIVPETPDVHEGGGNPESDFLMPLSNSLGESVWRTGIGVVSRYAIVDAGAHRLPGRVADEIAACGTDQLCAFTVQFESRAALRALVDAPGGPVQVVSTHLVHNITSLSGVSRVAQNEALLGYLDAFSHGSSVPVVLTGDFNSIPESTVHTAVRAAGFVDTFGEAEPSDPGFTSDQEIDVPTSTVDARIDYVFARPGACASPLSEGGGVLSSEVIGDAPSSEHGAFLWPSDHYGVVSELRPFPDASELCPVAYTASFTERVCTALGVVADRTGVSESAVVRAGVEALRALAESGRAVPVAPPPSDGSCKIVVDWSATDAAGVGEAAEAWGVTAEQLHQAGGRFVLLLIYYLAVHGG